MPAQPTTKQLTAVRGVKPPVLQQTTPDWALELHDTVTKGFTEIHARLDEVDVWRLETDVRLKNNSSRAAKPSAADLKTEADLAQEIAERKARDEQLSADVAEIKSNVSVMVASVRGVLSNPKVRSVGKVLWFVAMAYAAAKGIKVLP
jgi:hypothetical protein